VTSARRHKILLVDDEPDITTIIKRGLELENFDVDVFNDPTAALDEFVPKKYDLVLLDIRMPKMNGFELYRELLKRDDRIRVCFITAFEVYYDDFKRLFPAIEVSCFVHKPVSIAKLAEIIRRQLVGLVDKPKI